MEKIPESKQEGKQEISEETITLDMKKINEKIEKEKLYKQDNIFIKWDLKQGETSENLKDEHKYFASISNSKFTYIGALNADLQRNCFGRNEYTNGDIYLGGWDKNKKNKYGIYVHKPENDQIELYHGHWSKGVKDKMGIYIWKKGEKFDEPFEKATIDAFIGNFSDGKFSQGLFVSQKVEGEKPATRHYYFGKFDKEGRKMDENAYYYMENMRKLFHGQINDDKLVCGEVVMRKEDGSFENPFNFYKGDDGAIETRDLENEEKIKALELFTNFIEVIEKTNFFELLVNHGKECIAEVMKYSKMEEFESQEGFAKDLKFLTTYGDINSTIKPLFLEAESK